MIQQTNLKIPDPYREFLFRERKELNMKQSGHTKLMKLLMVLLTLCTFVMVISPLSVNAEEGTLTVDIVPPDNQIDKEAGFFDLKVTPGQEQVLILKITNTGDKEISANIEVNPAFTGDGGAFVYTRPASERDESMLLPLSDLITADEMVSLPPKGVVEAKLLLKVPTEPFEGIILGGVRVKEATGEEKKDGDKEKEGFNITNTVAYVKAIRLIETEALPESDMKLKGISATQLVGRNAVNVTLQNPTATIINKVSYEAKIYKKGNGDVLHERKVDNYRVAPNTQYNLAVSWENQPFMAGTYELKLKARAEGKEKPWEFSQEFTISEKEAKELNDKAIDLEKNYTLLFISIGIGALILIIILVILIVWLAKKRKIKKRRKKKSRSSKGKKETRSNDSRKSHR